MCQSLDEFVGMMIYDGCFIVRLIRDGYPEDVCKLGRHIRIDIWYDLLLLENQLPFFLLLELDRIITKNSTQAQRDFSTAALSFFRNDEYEQQMWFRKATHPSSKEQEPSSSKGDVAERKGEENKERVDHLLDLVYKCCRPSSQGIERHQKYSQKLGMGCQRSWKFIRSATGLDDAGINFSSKKVLQDQGLQVEVQVLQDQDQGLKDEVQGLFDIMFTRVPIRKIPIHNKVFEVPIHDKVLEIPTLVVDDNTERMLRNLLAYEQFNETEAPTYVYDYVMFMDNLINTDKDVQLLCASGVIDNWLGGDEAVAQMFNKLRDKVYSSKDFYYAEIFDMVDKHCEQKWNRHRAKLCKDYFGSPWSFCSFVAAFVLLVVTVVQTAYACIGYYYPSSK